MCNDSDCCETPKPVKEEIVFITDDLSHSADNVLSFSLKAEDHLTRTRQLDLGKIIQFTDGCPGQYKSKIPFMHLSQYPTPTERNFFGSRHGKGPADGCSSVVKSAVTRAVTGNTVIIKNGQQFYKYCLNNLAKDSGHSRRTFFYKKKSTDRPKHNTSGLTTLKGSHALQSVKSVGQVGVLCTRSLSCYCQGCDAGRECENRQYVVSWDQVQFVKGELTNFS